MKNKVVIEAELETKQFDAQIEHIKSRMREIENELKKEELGYEIGDPLKLEAEYEKLGNQLLTLKDRQEQFNNAVIETKNVDFSSVGKSIDKIGNSIGQVIKKLTKWGLAVFGIRSMYLGLRRAVSILTDHDEQLKSDIEYIKTALAYAIEPIVRKIVEIAKQLMYYVAYVVKALTGRNIFAKANKAIQNTTGSAKALNKELNKTIASFDEMNVLQNNSSSEGGTVAPSFDLSDIENQKVPKWLEKIVEVGKWIKDNWQDVVEALLLTKLFFDLLTGNWIGVILDLIGLLALTYAKILEINKAVEDLNKIRKEEQARAKKSKESTESLIKTYNETAKTTGVTKEQTKTYIDTLLEGTKTNDELVNSMEKQKNWLGALNGQNKEITKTQETYNKTIQMQLDELKKLYDEGKLNNKQKAEYVSLLDKQTTKLATENQSLNKNSDKFKENTEKIKKNKEELEKITGKKYEVKTSIQTPDTSAFERKIRDLLYKVGHWFSEFSIGFGFGNGGGGFRAKGGIYYPSKLPKLAMGGIINSPGTGVAYHGATIGERGAEAVVPLTDTQQMQLLGEAIGKYININATVPVYVGNRLVARELKKIEASQSFAVNR